MKHRSGTHGFGRQPGGKKALIRGLVISMVEHERIKTTLVKAKEARRHVEKAITTGKAGDFNARRLLMSRYPHPETVEKIVTDLSVRFKDRAGGYTRIIKIGNRPGDNAPVAFLEFVDYKLPEANKTETVKADKKTAKPAKTTKKAVAKSKKTVAKTKKKSKKAARKK